MIDFNPQLMAALAGVPTLWLGSQESFDCVAEAYRQVSLLTPEKIAALEARVMARDENGLPMIWEKRGATAVINVTGQLVDGNAGYMRYFRVIGYDDIAEAAIAAYSDPDVKKVMWKIESPGGQVSGVMDLGAMISLMSGMKSSMTYTANLMASGGYWLATAVKGEIVAGPTAEVGSIGVLMVLTDVTKALADQGIKKTIMRAGDDKARINPLEAPRAEDLALLQQSMDDVHGLFRAQVSKGRPNLSTEDMLAATTGRTFLGKRAKSAGLVDKVASFEQALKLLDSQNPTGNTPSNSKGATMKTVLTTEQIAKMAAGVPVEQLGLSAEAVIEVNAFLAEQAAAAKLVSDKAAEDAAKAALQATADAAAAEAAKKLAGTTETDITKVMASLNTANIQVDLLKSQLTTAQASLVTKEAELTNLKVSHQTMTETHTGLTAAVRTALGRLQISMGGSDTSEGMEAAAATAEFTRLDAVFKEKFKIGQASKPVPETKPATQPADAAVLAFQRTAAIAQANRTAKQ